MFSVKIGCMKVRLWSVPECRKYTDEFRPLEGLPTESVVVSNESLEECNVARIRCG